MTLDPGEQLVLSTVMRRLRDGLNESSLARAQHPEDSPKERYWRGVCRGWTEAITIAQEELRATGSTPANAVQNTDLADPGQQEAGQAPNSPGNGGVDAETTPAAETEHKCRGKWRPYPSIACSIHRTEDEVEGRRNTPAAGMGLPADADPVEFFDPGKCPKCGGGDWICPDGRIVCLGCEYEYITPDDCPHGGPHDFSDG